MKAIELWRGREDAVICATGEKDVKTQFVCKLCALFDSEDHMSMTIIFNACKVQDAEGEESQ